jgi:hypothetical protein
MSPTRARILAALRVALSVTCSSAIALGTATPRVARADVAVTADEEHVQRGVALRSVGKNREALSEFEAAAAIRWTARTRAQIALAHQALGDWVEAEAGLEEALRAEDDAWIAQYRDALERALDIVREHLASLVVDADVDGAELFVDARRVGLLPLRAPVRVARAIVIVEVRAKGYVPLRRTVDLTTVAHAREVVSLEAEAPVVEVGPAPLAHVEARTARAPIARPRSEARTAGILTLGGAGLFALGGIAAWRARVNAVDAYNSDAVCVFGDLTREQRCGHYRSAAGSALGFEIGAFAIAGAATLAGVGLLVLAPPRREARAFSPVACGVGLGPGVTCGGAF